MVALAWLLWRPNIWVWKYAGIALFFLLRSGTNVVVPYLQYLSAARGDFVISDRFAWNFNGTIVVTKISLTPVRQVSRMQRIGQQH